MQSSFKYIFLTSSLSFTFASRYQAPNHERADASAPVGGAPGRARLHRGNAHPERLGYRGLLRCSVHTRDTREGRTPPPNTTPNRNAATHITAEGWWQPSLTHACIFLFITQHWYVWLSAPSALAIQNTEASLWFNVTLWNGAQCLHQCHSSNREPCIAGMRCNYIGL